MSLTGHISTVRGLAVSPRHPYLFSAGEDKVSFLKLFVNKERERESVETVERRTSTEHFTVGALTDGQVLGS